MNWRKLGIGGAIAVAALGLLTAITWPAVPFAAAVLLAEKRPALLADIRFNQPDSDKAFRARFHPGMPEAELLAWLETNRFSIDRANRKATRHIDGLPCSEVAEIRWSVQGPALAEARAAVADRGCL
jgi:hypothetical protein